jgi:hypothetical protein
MRRTPLVILFVALAAAAAGVAYAVREPSPQVLVTKAFRHLNGVRAVSMKVTASAYAPASLSGGEPAPVILGGAFHANIPKEEMPSLEAAFSVLGSGGGERDDVSVEARALAGGDAFVKFDGLSSPADAKAAVGELNGTWYAMPGRELAALLSGKGDVGAGFSKEESLLLWKRIRETLTGGEIFAYGGKMPNEVVAGVPLRHFALLLDGEGVARLAKDVRSALLGRELRADEVEGLRKELSTHQAVVEVWIDKRAATFKKMTLVIGAADATADKEDLERKNLVIEFQAFPEPGGIDAPADAKPFADVVPKLFKTAK